MTKVKNKKTTKPELFQLLPKKDHMMSYDRKTQEQITPNDCWKENKV